MQFASNLNFFSLANHFRTAWAGGLVPATVPPPAPLRAAVMPAQRACFGLDGEHDRSAARGPAVLAPCERACGALPGVTPGPGSACSSRSTIEAGDRSTEGPCAGRSHSGFAPPATSTKRRRSLGRADLVAAVGPLGACQF